MISVRIQLTIFFLFASVLIFAQQEDTTSSQTGPGLIIIDTSYFEKGNDGFNLILAAEKGDLLAMELLLRRGTDPDWRTFEGVTPLMYASEYGNSEAVLLLLGHGADPNTVPDNGVSALISSSKNGSYDVSNILLDYGASVNMADEMNLTSLMYSAAYNYADLTGLYLEYGADLTRKEMSGSDALIIAAYYGSYESARVLIEYGADVNTTDNFNFTPLIIASQMGHYDLVWLLLENGADISLKNLGGYDALAMSVQKSHGDITELLIENGAKVNNPVQNGNNPLDIAKTNEDEDLVDLLKSNGARSNPFPYFKTFSAGWGMDFNQDDFMTGLYTGIHDSKYGLDIRFQILFRPAPVRVLVEESNELAYQFWEKRWLATGGIHKKFIIKAGSGHEIGPVIGMDVNYTWGSFRGTDRKPNPSVVFSPSGGLFWKYKVMGVDLLYSYKNLKIPDFCPHRISLVFNLYFNTRSEKLMYKTITWIEK